MAEKIGSSIVTYRLKLRSSHIDWIQETENLYNKVLEFYYGILTDHLDFLELSNMEVLRRLEQMTIVGRNKQPVVMPLPFHKVPLYFRRSAINAAIGHIRSYIALLQNWERKKEKAEKKGHLWKRGKPAPAKRFHASVVFYKGMFKEFGEGSILLKLWNGRSWIWVRYTYYGRKLPKDGIILSPTLINKGKKLFLSVSVKFPVKDIRKVKERKADKESFCAVHFTASEVLAVCAVFSGDGHVTDSYFVRGGKEFIYRRKRLLNRIKKVRKNAATGGKKLRRSIFSLSGYYAHLVSRRILDYCKEKGVKGIIVPKYAEVDGYLYGKGMGYFLGKRIIQLLRYKAWREGIILTSISPYHTASHCCHCGAPVKRYNEGYTPGVRYFGGRLFICQNSHQGNAALNAAKNMGYLFYETMPKEYVETTNTGEM